MKLDKLLDDWDDLTIDLYLREKEILSKYMTLKVMHIDSLNKMFALGDHVGTSRRRFCKMLVNAMNMSVFSDELVSIRFLDMNHVKISETHICYNIIPEVFIKEVKELIPKNAVYIQVKVIFNSKRQVFEKRLSLSAKEYFEKRIQSLLDKDSPMYYSPLFYKLYDRLEKKRNLYALDLFMQLYSDVHQRIDEQINNRQDSLDTVIDMSKYDKEVLKQYKFALSCLHVMMEDLKLKEEYFSMLELSQKE